jgi:hypothetical protein
MIVRGVSESTSSSSLAPPPGGAPARPCENSPAQDAVEYHDRFLQAVLCIFRSIGAAYVTGVSDCWEAAYRFADEAPGIPDSALLVARVGALVRTIRCSRGCELACLPPSCSGLSKDEAEIMRLLRRARGGPAGEVRTVGCPFACTGEEGAILQAVEALAALSTGDAVRSREPPRLSMR